MFNENQLKTLNSELDGNRIKSHSQSGINLSYLEGFDIIDTANNIFGYGNWSYNIVKLESVSQEINKNQNHVICYRAIVSVTIHDEKHTKQIVKEDVGYGSGIAKTLADSHQNGGKEAVTDSLKRCLRSLGTQFGNSLYNKSRSQPQNNNHSANNMHQPPQQQYNNPPNNQPPQMQQNNQQNQNNTNQQNFNSLQNHGIKVVQEGSNLIAIGDNLYNQRDLLKQKGFKFSPSTKQWWIPISNQQVA